ncbi:Lnb N-terminal periplasmic domain-containing protein, partial [Dryocola clanedunensis]
ETDYDARWVRREYNLDQLRSADLILSYWMGPAIAHTLISFGFDDGRYLVFSLEIRKERGESFSALGGFFRKFEMTLVASEETDIVRTRTNARGEDVYLYRLHGMTQAQLKALFVSYLGEARKLDAAPAFYNTLTSNCTTIVYELAKQIAPGLPMDYRLLASGYFAEYARDLGVLTPGVPFEMLKARGRITDRARASHADDDFSQVIRRGVPGTGQGSVP